MPVIEHYGAAVGQFERLLGTLTREETQRVTPRDLEAMVQAEGSELLRRLTQAHLDQRGAQEPIRERLVGEDGIFGDHSFGIGVGSFILPSGPKREPT